MKQPAHINGREALRAFGQFLILVAAILILYACTAYAQHNHERHHSDYLDWASGKTSACCNHKDCGALEGDEWRETNAGLEVLIANEWCPVLREHLLIRGKSPDASTPHACIGYGDYWQGRPACERLLCFTGRGGY